MSKAHVPQRRDSRGLVILNFPPPEPLLRLNLSFLAPGGRVLHWISERWRLADAPCCPEPLVADPSRPDEGVWYRLEDMESGEALTILTSDEAEALLAARARARSARPGDAGQRGA